MSVPLPPSALAGHDLRILRAAVFAAVCVVLAGVGHSLASGATVPSWTLGAGLLGTAALVAPLAGRARSLPGVAAALGTGQVALHALFGAGQHGAVGPASTTGASVSDTSLVRQAARLMCGMNAAAITPDRAERILTDARLLPDPGTGRTPPAAASVPHVPEAAPSLSMFLGHVLAALAAGWLLRRGDLALARLVELSTQSARAFGEEARVRSLREALRLARALCVGLPVEPEGEGRIRTRAPAPEPRALAGGALHHTLIRRGPPESSYALAA
ncbi:hypothetical protein [Streptomyces sp. WMMC905]|uniref:hypothetical protein n=1 Tax=Streptomyces sp. WMMC905 TaxID=3404123 RepID=UPI003B95C8C3